MAGFQQAANALTGAIGTVGGRIGVYNELVGKNQELIKKTQDQNEQLEKKNEELGKKNEELRYTNMQLNETINASSSIAKDYVRMSKMAGRVEAHERAVASRNKMLDIVYGEKPHTTAGPTGNY